MSSLERETSVNRLARIRSNLKLGAVVVREVALLVPAMGRHELDDLQGAF
jgi:hypothetical protein